MLIHTFSQLVAIAFGHAYSHVPALSGKSLNWWRSAAHKRARNELLHPRSAEMSKTPGAILKPSIIALRVVAKVWICEDRESWMIYIFRDLCVIVVVSIQVVC